MVSKVIQTFGGSDCLVLRSEKICSQVQIFFLACCFYLPFANGNVVVREEQRDRSRSATWSFANGK